MKKKHPVNWEDACRLCLVGFLILYLMLALLLPTNPYGESGSNMMSAISLSEHFSYKLTEADLEKFCELFPAHAENGRVYYANLKQDAAGNRYPWYLGIYAPLCIPMLKLLLVFQLDPAYAFPLTNALFLVLSLWVLYRFLPANAKQKLLMLLFLGESPIILYTNVQLYEMVLFAFVVMAITFWLAGRKKLAAFLLSLAGTMNVTVMAFGFVMIGEYFWEFFLESGKKPGLFWKNCLARWKDILLYAICFIPCLIPVGLSYAYFGTPVPASSLGMGQLNGMLSRFWAYLVDLNFGFLPYIPVVLILFIVLFVRAVRKKDRLLACSFLGALVVMLGYSLINHINCGMTGMARYNAWALPMLVMPVIFSNDRLFRPGLVRRFMNWATVFSVIWCGWMVGITGYGPNQGYCFDFSPMAKIVLDNAPQLYHPLPSTFNSRTNHLDGGYVITDPVVYLTESGYVRKALVTTETLQDFQSKVLICEEDEALYRRQCAKVVKPDKFYYLNFSADSHIHYIEKWYKLGQTAAFDGSEQDAHDWFISGVSGTEGFFAWTEGKAGTIQIPVTELGRDLELRLDISGVYTPPQRLTVRCGDMVLYDEELWEAGTVCVPVPAGAAIDHLLQLDLEYPGAISPHTNGESGDTRELAFAITSFTLNYAEQ